MSSRMLRGPARISGGVAVLAMVLAGCGGGGGTGQDAKSVADSPTSASPSAEPALTLVDDEASADAGKEIVVEALANDSVTLADGTDAVLLDTYEPAELVLSVATQPAHGTVSVDGTSVAYTATAGYGGADEFTYRLVVEGKTALSGTAVVRITVAEPTPTPTPTPSAKPKPKVKPEPKKTTEQPAAYYANCDAVRAAGAAPIHRGEPGYASRLDRDGDGVGCEPYSGGSGSGGSSSSGGGSSTGGGGDSGTYYANCSAVRAAGAAPIHAGDPGYGSHLDRDGDGVACE